MLKLVFDANALITCCQATTSNGPVIANVLEVSTLCIPQAVQREVNAASTRYSDARLAEQLVATGHVTVLPVRLPTDNVLDHYRLGSGEKESIAICLDQVDLDFLVTDDRLAYVVGQRCGISTCLFLDLVIEFVERQLWTREQAEAIIQATQHRFASGFVSHTLTILRAGDRKCLK